MSSKKKQKHKHDSDEEDDDVFYYRYCASSSTTNNPAQTQTQTQAQAQSKTNNKGSGETLAPSKSTLYISNLDYSLTNSDLHTLFSTFGKIARVTVLKDRNTRRSRGVAFIQFVSRHDAQRAVTEMDKKVLNGRTLTASIAADNGRAPEFIKKRVYNTETGLCFECGDHGHLSYECPKNQLGPRARPMPKKARRGFGGIRVRDKGRDEEEDEEEDESAERLNDDNWASTVDDNIEERLLGRNENDEGLDDKKRKKKGGKRVGYFSDESDHDDDDD